MPRLLGHNSYALGDSCYTGPAVGVGPRHAHVVTCATSYDDGHRHHLSMAGTDDADQAKAAAVLRQMRRSLSRWLRVRRALDQYIAGDRPAPILGRRARPLPPRVAKVGLQQDRFRTEQDLANQLYALLQDCGIPAIQLPSPDVSKDSEAAVKLATIAVAGKTPDEVPAAQAQGIVWFALAIPAAAVVLMWSYYVKSKADAAAEAERLRCIQAGACTDYGFWLKWAAVAGLGWFAWDKMGVRDIVARKSRSV